MQTVWSRVAQPRFSCNCSSCVSATTSLARRVTTSASRRRIRVGDAFTLSLSSLAVAATFVDSKRKDSRRYHWDRVISKARADVEEIEHQQESRLETLSRIAEQANLGSESTGGPPNDSTIPPIRYYDTKSQWYVFPDMRSAKWVHVLEWATQQDQLRAARGFQDFKGVPFNSLQELSVNEVEQLLDDKNTMRRFFYESPDCSTLQYEPIKLLFPLKTIRTCEWSMAMMVWQLLSHCSESSTAIICRLLDDALRSRDGKVVFSRKVPRGKQGALDHPSGASTSSQSPTQGTAPATQPVPKSVLYETHIYDMIALAKARLKSLWEIDKNDAGLLKKFKSPLLPVYGKNPLRRPHQTFGLNQTLLPFLSSMDNRKDLSPMLSRVCFALLTFKNPPTVRTYNLLLTHFCRLRNGSLVLAVWNSMRESHIRPDEKTYSTLLRFFTSMDDEIGFRKLVRRIKGYDGGVFRGNENVKIEPIAAQRVQRVRYEGYHSDLVLEKARMNGEVYESLIIGALKFMGEQTAMHYYKDMISEGWGTTTEILNAILEDCCNRADWEGGFSVWQQLLTKVEKASEQAYEWMLRLCQECDKYHEFYQVLQEGTSQGILSGSMIDLLRLLKGGGDKISAEGVKKVIEVAKGKVVSKTSLGRTAKARVDVKRGERGRGFENKRRELSRAPMQNEQHWPKNNDPSSGVTLVRRPVEQAISDECSRISQTPMPAPDATGLGEDVSDSSSFDPSAKELQVIENEAEADLSAYLETFHPRAAILQRSSSTTGIIVRGEKEGNADTSGSSLQNLNVRSGAPAVLAASA